MRILIIFMIIAGSALLVFSFSGCYLIQQGVIILRWQLKAQPVSLLLADEQTPEDTREFLLEVRAVRDFAEQEIGLEPSRHYTTYVEIERSYLLALVSAAESLSLTPYTWRFPLVGSVPYKGYFQPEHARREARRLEARGYDTWISAVNAFSSLDILTDPLYSFMEHYSAYRLADLIIHELVHSTVWVKGHASFNEQLAMFIGQEGARKYVARRFGTDSPEYRNITLVEADQRQFRNQISLLRRELEVLFSQTDMDEQAMEMRKQEIYAAFQQCMKEEYDDLFLTDRYEFLTTTTLNNAYLTIQGVYHSSDDLLERLYRHAGTLKHMVELLRSLDGTRKDPYTYIEEILNLADL